MTILSAGGQYRPYGSPASHLGDARNGLLDGTGERQQQARDRLDVVQVRMRQLSGAAVPRVRDDGGDALIFKIEPRLPVRLAMHLDLNMLVALKTLDENEIGGAHAPQKFGESWLGGAAQFMHQGKAPVGGNEHLARARLAMQIRILARLIDVERMMRVLERRDGKAAFTEVGNELDDQTRLARAAPAGKADHPHGSKLRKALLFSCLA